MNSEHLVRVDSLEIGQAFDLPRPTTGLEPGEFMYCGIFSPYEPQKGVTIRNRDADYQIPGDTLVRPK